MPQMMVKIPGAARVKAVAVVVKKDVNTGKDRKIQ